MLGMADSGGGVEAGPGADLLAVAQRRDRDAFGRLFAFYAPRVKAYLGRVGVGDELADELTEETMLAVWQRAPRFLAARVPASAWIFAIARDKRAEAARPGRWPTITADEEAPGIDGAVAEPPIRTPSTRSLSRKPSCCVSSITRRARFPGSGIGWAWRPPTAGPGCGTPSGMLW